jgi:ASC-1-like (ASCH) protein
MNLKNEKFVGKNIIFNSHALDVHIRKLRSYFAADSNIEIVMLKGN